MPQDHSGGDSSLNGKRPEGAVARGQPRLPEWLRFIAGFLRAPLSVGALGPSSQVLAEAMVHGFDLASCASVVELGPGTGAFTGRILAGIGKATTFLAIERDPIFARGLQGRYPGVVVYNDSAEKLAAYLARHGSNKVDYIVSGLPWASLPLRVQEDVFEAILASLAPDGVFSTFAYLHACWLPNAKRFRERLQGRFSSVEKSSVVWGNLPPAFVYRCRK